MQELIDVLAAVAHAFRRGQAAGGGEPFERLQGILDSHPAAAALPREERFRALLLLRQVAAVGPGDDAASEQEILADWLAARHAARLLRQNPAAVAEAVGNFRAPATPAFERCLAEEFAADPELAALVKAAMRSGGESAAAALLRRVLAAAPRPAASGGGLLRCLFGRG